MEILGLTQYTGNKNDLLKQVKEIFFEASIRKNFESDEEKEQFFDRWCGVYWNHYPEHFYLALEGDQLLGYLSGCADSLKALEVLNMPGYKEFSDDFSLFPAHFHINCHHSQRGLGIGGKLTDWFCDALRGENVKGVFIITAPMSRPTSFYMKKGFNHSFTREIGSASLILMGKKL